MNSISPVVTELVGVLGSVVVLVSMLFKSSTVSGNRCMRHVNNIGSVLFIVYGALINAWSTIGLNVVMLFVNIYHLWKLRKKEDDELPETKS